MRRIACVMAVVAVAVAAWAGEAVVPVTKVAAFSSGVAYFEHNGKVTGNAEVVLKFKTTGVNDMLKSLVVMDLGEGTVSSINYASQEPLARALKSFGIDISGDPPLADLLKQVRGAEAIIAAPEEIKGKILTVETKTRHILPSNTVIQEVVLDLLTPQGIKAITLESVRSITLTDEKLNSELNKALALLIESRDTDSKPVQINFVGQGARDVRIGYIAEAPVWRTSYRLVLSDERKDQAIMQGWAIIENTSDFDWEKVDLTLVSGRPISFIEDLYTPLYATRPVVQPELYASLRPPSYEEGMKAEGEVLALQAEAGKMRKAAEYRRAPVATRALAAAPPAPGGPPRDAAGEALEKADARSFDRGVQASATGAAIGELFSYRIKEPVSLPRRRSAMLPIINQPIKARKVSIYNASVLSNHPLNGLWLENDTKMSLLGGPATVFDAASYAGDAQLGNLSPNDKRLLSYAIDLKVTIDPSASTSQSIVAAKIVRGTLEVSRRTVYVQTYGIKNDADQDRTIIVEHPFRPDLKLLEPAESAEKTPAVYRFEVKAPATKTGKFIVREEQIQTQGIAILPSDVGSIQWYVTNGEIPKKVRDALAEVITRKNALSQAEREMNQLQQRAQMLRREQDSVRANMTALEKGSQGYQRFEKKLLDLETQIETLQKQVDDKRTEVDRLRKELEDHLSKLNVE